MIICPYTVYHFERIQTANNKYAKADQIWFNKLSSKKYLNKENKHLILLISVSAFFNDPDQYVISYNQDESFGFLDFDI